MKLKINDIFYKIENSKDYTLIQKCEELGFFLPRFCYHSELSIAGNCRMCLIESNTSPNKPIIACATNISEDMELKINSSLVKSIRESILEFLLINHPLDCPICDQGGECDLQDLSVIYGSDRGRFKELKRSVMDKFLGHMLKTIMTRCIHCTRCIRFSTELLDQPLLGTLGRGVNTEVGTYLESSNRFLTGELLGNLIDLCPVGAITSKPYAFKARPWELITTETIDILDSTCSSIKVYTRSGEILRVLPRVDPSLNDCWISDKIRFFYDSHYSNRITKPIYFLKEDKKIIYSWEYCFYIIKTKIFSERNKFNRLKSIYFFTGNFIDLFSIFSSFFFCKWLGITQFNKSPVGYEKINTNFRNNYSFSVPFSKTKLSNLFLFLGVNTKKESPILYIRLRKIKISDRSNIFFYLIGGSSMYSNLEMHLGLSEFTYFFIINGKHIFSKEIKKKLNLIVYSMPLFYNNNSNYLLYKLCNFFNFDIKINYLNLYVGNYSKDEFSFKTLFFFSNNFLYSYFPNICYFFGYDDFSIINKLYTFNNIVSLDSSLKKKELFRWKIDFIYQGHHFNILTDYSGIILPTSSFLEKSAYYINCEKKLRMSTITSQLLGESWADDLVFYALLKYTLNINISKWLDFDMWSNLFLMRVPFLKYLETIISTNLFINSLLLKKNDSFFKTKRFFFFFLKPRQDTYYNSDIFSKNSLNLVKCNSVEKSISFNNFF